MEILFTVFKYLFLGFFGLIFGLFLLALVFGKRVKKQWEYEAEFRQDDGREFGEFDIEMSRVEKQEADYTLKAKFRMRHPSLALHQTVQVYVEDLLVLEGRVEKAGRIALGAANLKNVPDAVSTGQSCRVVAAGNELFSAALQPD